jgi:serine/threonine protein kinase
MVRETRGTSLQTLDDKYELSKQLGRGSTGTVWEARDRTTQETVAVKVLEPHLLASKNAKKRFVREVETAGALRHPHVVEVRAHGETADGGAYLVMELLAGKTLAARLRETGPLPLPRATKIIAQVLDAVLAAHRLGVVHRDLKPSNVMLIERDGDPDFVKVCDFGLAKSIERDSYDPMQEGALAIDLGSVTTELGHICGTPEYMAPEQARGEPVDERADLYAIAVMLFQTLVGRPPFSARSPLAVVSLHLTQAPPRPSELRPDLGIFPPLENLILRGLAKDRAERPSSAAVFRADLLRIERDYARWTDKRGGRPSPSATADADTVTLSPQPASPRPRRRIFALAAAGVVLSGFVGAARLPSVKSSPDAHIAPRPGAALDRPGVPALAAVPEKAPTSEPVQPVALAAPSAVEPEKVVATAATRRVALTVPKTASPAASTPPLAPPRPPLADANEALAQGKVSEACSLGEKALASSGASPAVYKFLGQCFMRLGEREKAVAYYRRYLEISPTSSDAVFIREMIK